MSLSFLVGGLPTFGTVVLGSVFGLSGLLLSSGFGLFGFVSSRSAGRADIASITRFEALGLVQHEPLLSGARFGEPL